MQTSFLKKDEGYEYLAFLMKIPSSSPFHLREWGEVLEMSFPLRSYCVVVKEGNSIVASMSLYQTNSLIWGRKLTTGPFNFFAGPLYFSEEGLASILDFAVEFTVQNNLKYLEIKTSEPISSEQIASHRLVTRSHFLTSRLKLDCNPHKIFASLNSDRRRSVRKGIKLCEIIDSKSLDEVETFYSILSNMYTKRYGAPTHSLNLFKNVWNVLNSLGCVKLFLAYHKGNPIGGMLLLMFNHVVYYAWGATDPESRMYAATDALLWRSIEWSCLHSFRIFDFGLTSPYQEGLLKFKEDWSTDSTSLPYYYFLHDAKKVPEFDYYKSFPILKKLWKKMPTIVARQIGSFFVREVA